MAGVAVALTASGMSRRPSGPASALEALVLRASGGEARAFDRLMIETEDRVLSVAWRLLGNREDARDAAQETYVRVFRNLAAFRAGQDPMGWIYRIAVNVCKDAVRRRRRCPIVSADTPEAPEGIERPRAEDALLEAERRSCVREALALLPEKERAAVILRDLEGLTSEEVGRILGSRAGTVRAQVASARAKIRAHCERVFRKGGMA